jgi:hypothetical protein
MVSGRAAGGAAAGGSGWSPAAQAESSWTSSTQSMPLTIEVRNGARDHVASLWPILL